MKKNSLLFSNMLPFFFLIQNSFSSFKKNTKPAIVWLIYCHLIYTFLKLTLFIKKFHQQVNCDNHKMAT